MILINSSPRNPVKLFQPFTPVYVPIGLGYLMEAAARQGIDSVCVDEQVEDDIIAAVQRHIASFPRPAFFGFSVLTLAFASAIRAADRLKALYPDCTICFGGIHPTALPDEVLGFPSVDYVIRGEGEIALPALVRALREGGDLSRVGGLSYRKDGGIVHNDRAETIDDLDAVPFPYHRFTASRYDLGFVVSSRGCPYNCIFCSNRVTTGKKYRVRSAAAIADELEMLLRTYGRRQILFLDDNLLVNRERIAALMAEIRRRGLHEQMHFSFQARGDNVTRPLLRDLSAAGFRSVFFGLETASERIMKIIKKGETVAQCADAVRMAKEQGLHVSATFIYALPGETHQDRMDAVRMSRDLGIDMVRFNNATPYPGTELYDIAKREGRLVVQGLYENYNAVSTFIENPFRPIPFSYVPAGNTEDEIRRDILFSYFRYYLDWARLKKVFVRPDLGVRWFDAGRRFRDVLRKVPALAALALLFLFKMLQFFHYAVLKRGTAVSWRFFFSVFEGLCGRRGPGRER